MAGGSLYRVTDNTVHNVSAQRVNIKRIIWHNDDGATMWMQMFDLASANVSLGTTVPGFHIQLGANSVINLPMEDMLFETAFSFAITTDATGSTGGTLNMVAVSYF